MGGGGGFVSAFFFLSLRLPMVVVARILLIVVRAFPPSTGLPGLCILTRAVAPTTAPPSDHFLEVFTPLRCVEVRQFPSPIFGENLWVWLDKCSAAEAASMTGRSATVKEGAGVRSSGRCCLVRRVH